MTGELMVLFAAAALIAAALANIALWSPRKLWIKLSAIGAAALFLPVAYGGLAELLSRPKPVSLEWAQRAAGEATVIAADLRENRGIYLWLGLDGRPEPRAYVLPWDLRLARQIKQAQDRAKKTGTGVRMRAPFARSWDESERKFYAAPQPALPPKTPPDAGLRLYRRSDPG